MPLRLLATCLALCAALPFAATAADDGYTPLFDGKTLDKWDGNPEFWRVEDGCITGQTTSDKPTKGNTFLIYRGGDFGDFELQCEYKIIGGNSGIQYRSFEVPDNKWVIGGYQGDFEAADTYSGINYGERFRGILANRGQKTVVKKGDDGKVKVDVVEQIGDTKEIQSHIKKEDWNSYHIIAKGYRFEHRINGVTTSICTDEHPDRRATGLLALQLHQGPPMKVQFKNIRIKTAANAAQKTSSSSPVTKKVLLLAGRKSHGFGSHDHTAGCGLLAKLIDQSGLPVRAEVHSLEKDGWPSSDKLAAANTIVIYADGGGGHPFNQHIDELRPLFDKGTGLVCIHYGTEIPAGQSGDALLDWTGGYFEANWSVNPHWIADFKKFPAHPVTQGVQPFKINDEWYYHMRFRDGMTGVTPLLTDLPPLTTVVEVDAAGKPVMIEKDGKQTYKLSRPENAHNNNPHVRKALIEDKAPQHMAWATENPGGHRGVGFTGAHYHWNWGHNEFRKLILNSLVWTAGLDVPPGGVPAGTVTVDDLLQNHDEPIPADFNKARIEAMLAEWNGK
ncbi:MAG TPA: family 16 glycoside hydrolase [Planctomycetaceae bacterium]|nr:family 16 glycoside hydrolase [Planctomycetaceae bacterium]